MSVCPPQQGRQTEEDSLEGIFDSILIANDQFNSKPLQTIPSKAGSGRRGAGGDQGHAFPGTHLRTSSPEPPRLCSPSKRHQKPKPGANPASGSGGRRALYYVVPPKAHIKNQPDGAAEGASPKSRSPLLPPCPHHRSPRLHQPALPPHVRLLPGGRRRDTAPGERRAEPAARRGRERREPAAPQRRAPPHPPLRSRSRGHRAGTGAGPGGGQGWSTACPGFPPRRFRFRFFFFFLPKEKKKTQKPTKSPQTSAPTRRGK